MHVHTVNRDNLYNTGVVGIWGPPEYGHPRPHNIASVLVMGDLISLSDMRTSVIIIIKHCYSVITNLDFIITYLMVTVLTYIAMFGNLYALDTLRRN